jgi:gamma-glutamyl:cysteine ligase YbdK (ATP-grasp superfamily)
VSDLSLFDAFGVELEYMIVDARKLNVRTIADRLLVDRDGDPVSDLEFGPIAWSNELVNHVVELKTNGPAKSLDGLHQAFHQNVVAANKRLAAFGAQLMPTAMHPWMNPNREKQLWLGDSTRIYQAFDKIFDCSGHGWSNLQSTHINLPFQGDEEFGRLHAAIRLILPLLPGLAASSPIHDGKRSPFADARLQFYIHHCDAIPSLVGQVIPEAVFTQSEYQESILEPLYRDIAPHDPEEILQEEFLNARGAIARFERGSIEIRLLDVQECPRADLAVVALVVEVLRKLVAESTASYEHQRAAESADLRRVLDAAIQSGGDAVVDDSSYLRCLFGSSSAGSKTIAQVWADLYKSILDSKHQLSQDQQTAIAKLLELGTLSKRIDAACQGDYSPTRLRTVYGNLCECLAENRFFQPN